MSNLPKCTSWLGHKFRPRYSTAVIINPDGYPSVLALIEKRENRTYVHDICVRCGHVVQKVQP
jgi:hypothetical protein